MLKVAVSPFATLLLMYVGWHVYQTRNVHISEQEIKKSFEENVPTGSSRRQLEQLHAGRGWRFKYYDIDEWHSYLSTESREKFKKEGHKGFYFGQSNYLGRKGTWIQFGAYLYWTIPIDKDDRVGLIEFHSIGAP